MHLNRQHDTAQAPVQRWTIGQFAARIAATVVAQVLAKLILGWVDHMW